MAIRREELTDEQYRLLRKTYYKYLGKLALVSFLYFGFLFFANFAIVLLDALYIHSSQFRFLMSAGTAVLVIFGLRGTIEEQRDIFVEKIKELVGHL